MSEVDNGSQYDGESVREMFLNAKAQYDGLVAYFSGQRQEWVNSMNEKLSQAQMIAQSLEHLHPQNRIILQGLIQERQQMAEEDRARVEHLDSSVEGTRQEIWNIMVGILHAGPGGVMNDLVHEFNWPTLEACQDLNLPLDYQYMVSGTYNPSTVIRDASGQARVQEGPQDTAETLYLKNRIAVLEAQVQKSNQSKVITKPAEAKEQVEKLDPIFLERRRRHRFATFDRGTPFEAQQWLGRFEVLADYLGFTNKEKTEELVAVFEGYSLDWFIGLEPAIRQDWEKVKQAFLHLRAQGSDPTLVAFDELKSYTQGDKPMKVFGPGLTSLLQRAGIYSPSIQLEYLKERLTPTLEQAVILRGATTLTEGINIATEIERSLSRAKNTLEMGPIKQAAVETTTMEQNYQQRYDRNNHKKSYGDKVKFGGQSSENRNKDKTCYKCGKKGHTKRDCWSKREHKQNVQELQDSGVHKVQDIGGSSDEEDEVNIFAHLMNNNQEVTKETTGGSNTGGRFKMLVTSQDGQQQEVLVDTGSTISTISQGTVGRLSIQEFACKEQIIRYGNTSTQIAASKAIWDFSFNDDESSRAFLLVVPNQNEEVILGMDWLEKEDILLHPKTKSVSKNRIHSNNNTDLMVEEILKDLVSLPTLAYPNPQLPYDVHCDASDIGLGACVVQQGRPVANASRTLNSAECNYTTTEKECLAVVWSLKQFHPYLYGSKFTIYTDHAALRSILGTKLLRGRWARWIMDLQEYPPYAVVRKKGTLNVDADALSRIAEVNAQNFDFQDISLALFQDLQKGDPTIRFIIREGVQKPYVWRNNLVCYSKDDKVVPFVPVSLVEQVLYHVHSKSTAGHFGVDKTYMKAKEIGWWPNMKIDVENWVQSCEGCQKLKVRNDVKRPPMKPITPTVVGEIWATDVAVLPTSTTGKRYILVIMEYLTKWLVAVPLHSFETNSIVRVLLYEVVLKYGLPRRLISDNGRNYISEAMLLVCSRLGISRSLTSVEHPQSDGLVERINRTIKTSLGIVVGQDKGSWAQHLPFVVFAYNTAKQASTRFSPFEVMFGRKATLPLLPSIQTEDTKTYSTKEWIKFLNQEIPIIQGKALENIKKAQELQAKQYNKKTRTLIGFKAGDLVLRKNHIKMATFPKERWSGPWRIEEASNRSGTAYKISKVQDPKTISQVNVADLRLFYERGNDVVCPTTGAS